MMRHVILIGAALMIAAPLAAEPVVLENDHVRVEVDPAGGGAVTRMVQKRAVTLPFTAKRGAGVAGIGRFFVPALATGEKPQPLTRTALRAKRSGTNGTSRLTLTAALDEIAPGLSLERTILMDAGESGFRIRDTYKAAKDVTLRVGAVSRHDGQDWNLNLRCWFGDHTYSPWRFTPYSAGSVDTRQVTGKRIYWRTVSQYGVGLLYQVEAPKTPAGLTHRLPKEKGNPAEFDWLSAPVALKKGESITVRGAVLIDEGGRSGGGPRPLATSDRVLVTFDLPRAGRSGKPMDCYVTVASGEARKVTVAISTRYVWVDWKSERNIKPSSAATELTMTLKPGLAEQRQFQLTPTKTGLYYAKATVKDAAGKVLAEAEPRAVIDGESHGGKGELGGTWTRYTARLPEVILKGSWEQIGEQVGKQKIFRRPRGGGSAKRLAFYDKNFPYYAKLVRGAAKAMGVKPETLAAAEGDDLNVETACMGLIFNGPEGPIHAYSKERSGSSRRGMGYVKIVPTEGYRFHMYTLGAWSFGYGVNSEGLATSGASINCDRKTNDAGKAHARKRADAGKMTAPIGTHMMMAMCKDVDEAVAFVKNPLAPLSFTGNMLISDATGKAVVLNSVGSFHQIVPIDGRKRFATGNYPFRRDDGLFGIGPNWGWAANTMLREHRVGRYLKRKNYQVGLRDVFGIMGDQGEPGNMNQHIFDNVGKLYSTSSVIAVAKTGDLYISNGPPDQVEYVRYRLKD